MVATLAKSGSSFNVNDQRSYDAWGVIRSGNPAGDPKGRYVANLGHVEDDESDLLYVRFRFYDPGTGRFLSEDGQIDGLNWFVYCQNNPVNFVDESGTTAAISWLLMAAGMGFIALAIWGMQKGKGEFDLINKVTKLSSGITAGLANMALWCFTAAAFVESGTGRGFRSLEGIGLGLALFTGIATLLCEGARIGMRTNAAIAVFAATCYGFRLLAELVLINGDPND